MKLFNKAIDRKLFKQYPLGSDLSKQEVVVKIFNPSGSQTWFIVNSDPKDPDYLWAIVDLGQGAEVGSVSRSELENYRSKWGLGFERDLSFDPVNAEELLKGVREGKFFAKGGLLVSHGLEEGDTVVKTIGSFQKVKTKDGSIVYVDLENGYRDSEPPLPFKKGGEVPSDFYGIKTLGKQVKDDKGLLFWKSDIDHKIRITSANGTMYFLEFGSLKEAEDYVKKVNLKTPNFFSNTYAKGGKLDDEERYEIFKNAVIKYSDTYELGEGYSSRFKGAKNKNGDVATGEYLVDGSQIYWNYEDKKGCIYIDSETPAFYIDLTGTSWHGKENKYSNKDKKFADGGGVHGVLDSNKNPNQKQDLIRERYELLNDMYNNEDSKVDYSDIAKVGDVLYGDDINGYARIVKEVNDPEKGDYFVLQDRFDNKFAFYVIQIVRDLHSKELKIQNIDVSEKDFLYSNEVINTKKELEFHKGRVRLYEKNPNDASNYHGIDYSDYTDSKSKIKELEENLRLYLRDETHRFANGGLFQPLSAEKQKERELLKENIIKALFTDKKNVVTEVTFKYEGKYSVPNVTKQDIKNMVFEINKSGKYPKITTYQNSHDVLSLKSENKYADGGSLKENKPYVFYFYYDGNEMTFNTLEKALQEAKQLGAMKVRDNLGGEYFLNYAEGGNIENFSDNQRMIMNQNVELEHHHEELEDILKEKTPVPAWVVSKMTSSVGDLVDVTHFLDGQKHLLDNEENEEENNYEEKEKEENEEVEDQDEIKDKEVIEPINVSAGTKKELTETFTKDALGNLKGFLKGMEGIELRDDYTFDYKDEQFEVEPIIKSDEKGVSNAVFTIFDGDGEEVGEVAYSRDGGKQKFTANSDFFSWNNAKFEDGGFMNNVYADGGISDKIKVGDTIFRAYFTNDYSGEKSSVIIIAENIKEAEEKAKLIDSDSFSYVSNGIKIKNEEQLFEETRENEPIYKYADGGYFDGTIPKVPTYMSTYAKGGEIATAEILGLKTNIMGTTDIEMKITGMRKPQDFIVYPISKDDAGQVITIQSDTRIGQIDLTKGIGVMSQSHSSGAYFVHLQMDKKTPFTLSEQDLFALRAKIFTTSGEKVGTRNVLSDNSGASKVLAKGGNLDKELEVSFIDYKDSEIMYEPHYNKYYANDVEFDSLQEAKDFIDSGKIDVKIRDAYSKGLFAKGGGVDDNKKICFSITNNYIGNLELGNYDIEFEGKNGKKSGMSNVFYNLSDAIDELFKYLKSENGIHLCETEPKSKFMIYKNLAGKIFDSQGYVDIESKVMYTISAKEVIDLKKNHSFELGGFMNNVYANGGSVGKIGYAIMQRGTLRTDAYSKVEFFDTIEKALFKMSHVPYFKSLTKEEKLKLIVPYTKGKEFADGGFIELNKKSLMPQEWELVEWSHNGYTPSFKGRMYFQQGTGNMFVEKEDGEYWQPKMNNKVYWREIKEFADGGNLSKIEISKSGKLKTNGEVEESWYNIFAEGIINDKGEEVGAKMNDINKGILYYQALAKDTPENREGYGWEEHNDEVGFIYKKFDNIDDLESFVNKKDGKTSTKLKKYIDHDDIKSVTLRLKGKEVTVKGSDVLNGANLLEKGGDLSKIANYVKKSDVIGVETIDGEVVKPANGYWVKKGAKAIGEEPTPTASVNSEPKFGETHIGKGAYGWRAETYVDDFNGYDWNIVTLKRYSGDLVSSAKAGKSTRSKKDNDIEIFTSEFNAPTVLLVSAKPSRITEKVIKEQHDKALANFKKYMKTGSFKMGGKISNFEKLSKEIAKEYEGEKVKPKYQKEYGKTYDAEEVKEVGNKVAGKIKAMQTDKKAFGGLFNKTIEKINKKTEPKIDLAQKQVKLKTGELVQVFSQNGNELEILKVQDIGSGARPYTINISEIDPTSYEMGGATFAEKSNAIAKNFVGKKVEPKYQEEYGKTYDAKEAKEVGNKIAGSMVKKSNGGAEILKKANDLAKQIRKDGESWNDAKRRAFAQLKK